MVFYQTSWAEPFRVSHWNSFIQQIVVKHLSMEVLAWSLTPRVAADSQRQIVHKDPYLPSECQALALPSAWGCLSQLNPF